MNANFDFRVHFLFSPTPKIGDGGDFENFDFCSMDIYLFVFEGADFDF